MGHAHFHRPFLSRRDFLQRAAIGGAVTAGGPWFWRQLAFAADAPVQQLHLVHGADAARQMQVSWMTPAPVKQPFVETAGERFMARTAQYAGYPGYFHHARLEDLPPATHHPYRVGHDGAPRSKPATFTTGPAGRTRFTFTAFGDQGTDGGAAQPPNQPSANTELARSFTPAFHVIVGDLAYANGDQAVWDDWFGMIEPMATTTPWMPTIGNHEVESGLDATGATGSWGRWGYDPYRTRFDLPGNGHDDLANCFYSFRYASVHFLCLDNNDVNDEVDANIGYTGGRQEAWVERELAAARLDPDVDFVVVAMHQCAFSSSSKHGSDAGVQRAWFDLFREHSVDLVLQGHDHTYERTHAMDHDRVVSEGPVKRTDAGTVYVVCGNGGAVQEPFKPEQPEWSAFRQALKIGTLKVEVEPVAPNGMARMVLGEYSALDGSPIEEGIVLERPPKAARTAAAAASGAESRPADEMSPSVGGVSSTAPSAPAPFVSSEPDVVLPVTGGPAQTALIGVAAAASGLALRRLTREERREELQEQSE